MRGLLLAGMAIFGASSLAIVTSASVVPALHAGHSGVGSGSMIVSEKENVKKILGVVNDGSGSNVSNGFTFGTKANTNFLLQHRLLVTDVVFESTTHSTDFEM